MLRRHARRVGIFIAGWIVVLVGLILVPLPGPGWVVAFVGLSLLASEFAWAARLRDRAQRLLAKSVYRLQERRRMRRRPGAVDGIVDETLAEVEQAAAAQDRTDPRTHGPVAS